MNYRMRFVLLSAVDMILLLASGIFTFFIIDQFHSVTKIGPFMVHAAVPYTISGYLSLLLFKSYKTLWQDSGLIAVTDIFKALIVAIIIITAIHIRMVPAAIPWIFHLFLWMTSTILIGGFRAAWIVRKERTRPMLAMKKKTLIIGAGEAGTMIVKQLLRSDKSEFQPIGFIDDDPFKQKLEILRIPVLGGRSAIPKIIAQYQITDAIIAMPSVSNSEIKNIVDICRQTSVRIKTIPRMHDLIHNRVLLNDVRDIDAKNLLGREIHKQVLPEAMGYLQDKVVLVTGAGGSIGSELALQVSQHKPKLVILLGHGENSIFNATMVLKARYPEVAAVSIIADIQDCESIENVFERFQPQVVFHAAAHKHVLLMEQNVVAAIKNNVLGTKVVAEAASKYGVERFVFISTDKAVEPVNVMGMTKRIGELIVQELSAKGSTRFSAVRFGNVLGSRGSVIPIFKKQIALGGPVTVTHPDMVRYFMTIPEAVHLVLEAGALSEGGEIFMLDMGQPVKIVDMAKTIIRLSGYEPDRDIKIVYTGIREGEKLNETLFYDDERVIKSKHADISIALSNRPISSEFSGNLRNLNLNQPDDELREELVRIIHAR